MEVDLLAPASVDTFRKYLWIQMASRSLALQYEDTHTPVSWPLGYLDQYLFHLREVALAT